MLQFTPPAFMASVSQPATDAPPRNLGEERDDDFADLLTKDTDPDRPSDGANAVREDRNDADRTPDATPQEDVPREVPNEIDAEAEIDSATPATASPPTDKPTLPLGTAIADPLTTPGQTQAVAETPDVTVPLQTGPQSPQTAQQQRPAGLETATGQTRPAAALVTEGEVPIERGPQVVAPDKAQPQMGTQSTTPQTMETGKPATPVAGAAKQNIATKPDIADPKPPATDTQRVARQQPTATPAQTVPPTGVVQQAAIAAQPAAQALAEAQSQAGDQRAQAQTAQTTTTPRPHGATAYSAAAIATKPPSPTPAPTVAEAAPVLSIDRAEPLIRFDPASPVIERISQAQILPQNTTPADQSRHIAQQLATAMPTTLPGTTEITLQPEELGRVRMTLSLQDGAMTLLIQADRAETTDLMRRHIDQLAQVYRQMGFDTLNFSFAGSAQQDADATQSDGPQPDPAIDEEPDATQSDPSAGPPPLSTTRLDLRI